MSNKLEIVINTSANVEGIKKASSTLNDLEHSTVGASKTIDAMSSSMSKANDAIDKVKYAFRAVGVVLGVRELVQYADTWNLLEGRLRLVTSSTNNLATVQKELFDIAQSTRQSYEATSNSFTKMSQSTQNLGKSQKDVLAVTKMVNEALVVSGATTEEASASILQLGQALGSGKLQGDELRSIMENAPRLAKAIADGMGVSVGQLKNLGAEGKLTSEKIFDALKSQKNVIDTEFGKLPKTIGQSLTTVSNSFMKLIAETDDATNASAALASTLTGVSGVFDTAADSIHKFNIEIKRLQDLRKINNFDDANTATQQIDDQIKALTTSTNLWDRSKRALESETNIRYKLNELYAAKAALSKRVVDLAVKENEADAEFKKNHPKTSIGLSEEEIKKAAAAAESLKQAYLSINKDIANFTGTEHDKAIANINEQAEKYRKSKVDEVKIGELKAQALIALSQKEQEEKNKLLIDYYSTIGDEDSAYYLNLSMQIDDMVKKGIASYDEMNTFREDSDRKYLEKKEKAEFDSYQASYDAQIKYIDDQRNALSDYYTTLGNSSDAFYITESDKIQKLAETGILSNEQLVAVWDKDFVHMRDSSIKLNTVFEDAFKSMEDSMVHMFMTGKFSAEDFFNTVIEGIIRMQIRNSITAPLTEAIGGVNFGSMFSGMFGGTSAQVDASSIGSSMDWSSLGKQAWEGGLIPYYAGGAVNNFTYGGYTGDGGKYEPKGVVHGGEYVIPKWQTQRIPTVITQLESMRTRGYADGGLVGSSLSGTSTPSMPVTINIENKSGTPISAESVTPQFDGRSMVINVVIDAINRNASGMRDVVRNVR